MSADYHIRDIDADGQPDEIVGHGDFHIERMDTNEYYISVGGLVFFAKLKGAKPRLTLRDFSDWHEAKQAGGPEVAR